MMKHYATRKSLYAFGFTREQSPARARSRFGVSGAYNAGYWAVNLWAFWAVKLPRTDAMAQAMHNEARRRGL